MQNANKRHQRRTTSSRLNLVNLFAILAASGITFIAYALDKRAAKKQSWRIQESRLHLLALLDGWPGALLAQQVLRHKSAKTFI